MFDTYTQTETPEDRPLNDFVAGHQPAVANKFNQYPGPHKANVKKAGRRPSCYVQVIEGPGGWPVIYAEGVVTEKSFLAAVRRTKECRDVLNEHSKGWLRSDNLVLQIETAWATGWRETMQLVEAPEHEDLQSYEDEEGDARMVTIINTGELPHLN